MDSSCLLTCKGLAERVCSRWHRLLLSPALPCLAQMDLPYNTGDRPVEEFAAVLRSRGVQELELLGGGWAQMPAVSEVLAVSAVASALFPRLRRRVPRAVLLLTVLPQLLLSLVPASPWLWPQKHHPLPLCS